MNKIKNLFSKRIEKVLCNKLYRKSFFLGTENSNTHYISFTFDDIPLSAAVSGGSILDSYGIKATFYVSMTKMVDKNMLCDGKMKNAMSCLINSGHEIGCHTFDHIDCSKKHKNLAVSISNNYNAIMRISPNIQVNSFSCPYGRYNSYSKKIIHHQFNTGRTTLGGINHGHIDLNLLKSNSLYSKHDSITNFKEIIDNNKNQHGWLIFHTHDVQEKPTEFGCTPKFFGNIIDYVVESGAIVEPVNTVYTLLQHESAIR